MKFVDSCPIRVIAGRGGNGCIAFRREKFIPHGGPSGGDGGRGGDIYFETDTGLTTLLDLTHARVLRAEEGENGQGSDCYGRGGEDLVCRVPVGTQVMDAATGNLLFDLDKPDMKVVVARGGKGGRGNIHFATPFDRAPRRAEPGEPGQERDLRLELKVLADVGLLGFPNVGKSTFIRACSRARPKVADYPFTTLVPQLGVVSIGEDASFVLADIPGLIPGAAAGAGLGVRFLKHVERTRALLHLVTLDHGEGRGPLEDYEALMHELAEFDDDLARRPMIVAMTKADLPEVREAYEAVRPRFAKLGIKLRLVSAATGEGVRPLLIDLFRLVRGGTIEGTVPAAPKPTASSKAKAKRAPAAPAKANKAAAPAKTKAAKKAKAPATPKKKAAKGTPKRGTRPAARSGKVAAKGPKRGRAAGGAKKRASTARKPTRRR